MRSAGFGLVFFVSITALLGGQTSGAKRAIRIGDMYRVKNVSDPQLSPEGKWVALS